MTEPELFAAYRHPAGYSAQCVCGTWIDAPNSDHVSEAVDVHNQSREHRQWQFEQDAVQKLRRPIPVRVCPCHDHGLPA